MNKLIAHRGLVTKHIKENTYLSIKNALYSPNFAGAEFDIRLTKDKNLVLMHDSSILRVTNNMGNIENMTLEEIRKHNYTGSLRQKIPTLKQILDINSNKIFLIEIKVKNNAKKIAEALMTTIKQYNKNIYIISFNKKVLNILQRYPNHPPLGLISVFKWQITNKFDFYCIRQLHANTKLLNKKKKVFIWGLIKNPNNKYYTIIDC